MGVNVAYGGESPYSDIGYTSEALELYRSGTKWKQFVTGNVEFYPAEDEDRVEYSRPG